MIAVRTNLSSKSLPENLELLRTSIEKSITNFSNSNISDSSLARLDSLLKSNNAKDDEQYYTNYSKNWTGQMGTLGGGNHFCEIGLDENDTIWIVVHSGSRGIGNQLASSHIKVAQELMDLFHIPLKDRDLAYLPQGTKQFDDYIEDMLWAQDYALLNREEMMDRVMEEFSKFLGIDIIKEEERINCHHNFTQMENHFGKNIWITRKGAIQMQEGQKGIIPGSMGTETYIVSGLANRMSFNSAPHGAGRRFSRNEAKRRFTLEDLKNQMGNIQYRHSEQLIDEIPSAYKDIEEVIKNSKELVKVEHRLNQILNVKGN